MANRTVHVTVGFILGIIYIPIDIIVINNGFNESNLSQTWLFWVIAILLSILGSEGPDLDQLYGFMSHRDIVTHSTLYPAIFFTVGMWWRITVNHALVSALIPFLIAFASHLFLDFFPNISLKDLADGNLRIGAKKGAYLVHLPFYYEDKKGKERKALSVKGTEWWLIINSLITCVMALLLATVNYYYPALPPIYF
ncbi:MAG: hypothetical protein FK731_13970 [Asgard group archaeon]|nr:hypothetical protein [Asgard group archaeon]